MGTGVGVAANQRGAGGSAVGTLSGREGPRDNRTVVVRGPFKGPSVFPWYPWAVVFVASEVCVHVVPERVLKHETPNVREGT